MLSGEYTHSIDAKGRLIIPAKFREALGAEFYVTKGTDRCLNIFPQKEWDEFLEKLKKLPRNREGREFISHMVGSAEAVNPDKMGRALIPAALREYAKLDKDVVLTGMIDRIDIWDKAAWDVRSESVTERIEEITESLVDQGFDI